MSSKTFYPALIFTLLIFLAACGQNDSAEPHGADEARGMLEEGKYESKATKDEEGTEQAISVSEDIHMNVISFVEEDDDKFVSMHYPEFEVKEMDMLIEAFAREKLDVFNTLLSSENISDKFTPQFNMTFQTNELSENVFALQFDIDSYISEDVTFNESEVIMVNKDTRTILTGEELFGSDDESREILYNVLLENMKNNSNLAGYVDEEHLRNWVFEPTNAFTNVRFTTDSAIFTFSQSEIAAAAAGAPVVTVDLDDIRNALANNITALIDGEYMSSERAEDEDVEEAVEKPGEYEIRDLDPNSKMIALTFDDGPDNELTPEVLERLSNYEARATFFLLGTKVNLFPDVVENIVNAGHEVGNHTWSHKDLTTISFNEITEEIVQTNEAIIDAVNVAPVVYRAPFGANNDEVDQYITLKNVDWDIDSEDWLTHNPAAINEMVRANVDDGKIVLMHDIHRETVDSLDEMLSFLTAEGYEFVTVSEILHYKGEYGVE